MGACTLDRSARTPDDHQVMAPLCPVARVWRFSPFLAAAAFGKTALAAFAVMRWYCHGGINRPDAEAYHYARRSLRL